MELHNFIVHFPGKKDGVIVLASHYETNYSLRNIHFVGANDGGSTTGLLIEIANYLRGKTQSMATASGWSSPTAKKPSRAGPTPTRLRQHAISRKNGRPTAR